jgi:hypothetical protein
LADRFIVEVAPIDYCPIVLLMPFGSHLAMDTLYVSGIVAVGATASAMLLGGRALRENMRFFTSELEAKPTGN